MNCENEKIYLIQIEFIRKLAEYCFLNHRKQLGKNQDFY